MLSIRFSRIGRRNAPSYRVVVMPKHRDPQSVVLEILGHYNPRLKDKSGKPVIELNADRIKHWIGEGAEVTDSVWNLLVSEKIVDGKKRSVTHITKQRAVKMNEKATAEKEKAEAAKAEAEAKAAASETPAEAATNEEVTE